jgi:hypothetical protein
MKILGLDGRNYNWNAAACQAVTENRSSLHEKAKILLDNLFPYDRILEEVSLPGSKTERRNSTLRADLFIPNRSLLIEVHGEQHYKFNKFFYKDKLSFYRAKARDSEKKEWCSLNDITLIEFNYNEDVDDWRRKVK